MTNILTNKYINKNELHPLYTTNIKLILADKSYSHTKVTS